jgi:predicted flavoprotein YhiN
MIGLEQGWVPMDRYDVIVVGGGPAGMMASGMAAKAGATTMLR